MVTNPPIKAFRAAARIALPALLMLAVMFTAPPVQAGLDTRPTASLSPREARAQAQALAAGEPFVTLDRGRIAGIKTTEITASIDIAAPPATVWAVMTDCDAALAIVPHLQSCTVLEKGSFMAGAQAPDRMSDVRRHVVRYSRLLPLTVNEFRSDYQRDLSITFEKSGGDLKVLVGSWRLEPRDDGKATRVHYQASLAIGQPVPVFLLKRITHGDTKKILRNLRDLSTRQYQDQLATARQSQAGTTPR
ncbi:MAG: SRPBCC family protein [Pseudomonadota bacterium]